MLRKIIKIEEEKCNGCTLCAKACHEGAIGMVNGKAKLLRDDYCDGLGDCLPACPTGAITFEEREAAPYDEAAVKHNMQQRNAATPSAFTGGCPGSMARSLPTQPAQAPQAQAENAASSAQSQLRQWPVQIKLVPVQAPFFEGAKLLIAADCSAFAYAGFHEKFMKNHITLVGCPKLDDVDYAEKLTEILRQNNIKSVTVARMEVPCCGGIENAVKAALAASGKMIPWQVSIISTDGRLLDN